MSDRWRALATAGHTGDEPLARGALTDDDPQARQLALGALDRMGALTDADVTLAASDADPSVRHRAALLAAHHDVDLMPLLRDPSPLVAEAAAWAAGERVTVPDEVLAELIRSAGDAPDPLVREACVASLGAIGDERGLPAILAACADKPAVRRRAVLALAPFEGPDVDAALEAALADRDWQVRQAAEDITPADD